MALKFALLPRIYNISRLTLVTLWIRIFDGSIVKCAWCSRFIVSLRFVIDFCDSIVWLPLNIRIIVVELQMFFAIRRFVGRSNFAFLSRFANDFCDSKIRWGRRCFLSPPRAESLRFGVRACASKHHLLDAWQTSRWWGWTRYKRNMHPQQTKQLKKQWKQPPPLKELGAASGTD